MKTTAPPPLLSQPPAGSIAAMVRGLHNNQPSAAFRDAAIAILRLSRTRGRVECDALGSVFEDETTSDERRLLILDLLGTAGTPEAQIVMRRLLALAVARRDSRTFASFVQRLGFVEHPDVPTLRFLMSVYAESRCEAHEVRAACAYTLGAAAGRAYVWGLQDAALHAANAIRRDLMVATSPAEKCALVTALGNAGLESDVVIIVGFVDDPDARVRSAAALGLRKMHTYESKSALLSILSGSDHNVAESALSALFGQSLDLDELIRLAQLVLSGRTALSLDSRVLRLMITQKLGVLGTSSSGLHSGGGCPIVEEAIHLLLTRVEEKSAPPGEKICDGQTTQVVNESGAYVRFAVAAEHAARAAAALSPAPLGAPLMATMPSTVVDVPPPVPAPAPEPPTTPTAPTTPPPRKRARMIAVPKTPLPYSAGYRMVSSAEAASSPDTVDDAKLAAMFLSSGFDKRPSDRPAARAGSGMRTLMHGSASDALRACTPPPMPKMPSAPPPPAAAPQAPAAAPAAAPAPNQEARLRSAYAVASPIAQIARIG